MGAGNAHSMAQPDIRICFFFKQRPRGQRQKQGDNQNLQTPSPPSR
jgi:hypothetical protein